MAAASYVSPSASATSIPVFAGERRTAIVPIRTVRRIAAALFFAFGVMAIVGTTRIQAGWPM